LECHKAFEEGGTPSKGKRSFRYFVNSSGGKKKNGLIRKKKKDVNVEDSSFLIPRRERKGRKSNEERSVEIQFLFQDGKKGPGVPWSEKGFRAQKPEN